MFEDSLVESRGQLASKGRRWITVGSIGLQSLVAAVVVVVPLVRPEALPIHALPPTVIVPALRKVPSVVQTRQVAARASAAIALPSVMAATRMAVLPSMRPVAGDAPVGVSLPSTLAGMGTPGLDPLAAISTGPSATALSAPRKVGPVRVSAGVSAGMLLGEIRPIYPRIAVAARVEGTVIIEATISSTGLIESARVVSGPPMLSGAAIAAVREARYRPYRLNGEATDVATTITITFKLGNT